MNKPFAKRFNAPRLSADEAQRQGQVSKRAFEVLGTSEATIAFLNAHDDSLGGRPLDVAVKSADGLSAVERLLEARRAG